VIFLKVLLEVLKLITKRLEKANIEYIIGGSLILYSYGIIENCHDIDILFQQSDIEKVLFEFKDLIFISENERPSRYLTNLFMETVVDGVPIDFIFGFAISINKNRFQPDFRYRKKLIDHKSYSVGLMEDWYVIYLLIGNREDKIRIMDEYFQTNPPEPKEILRLVNHKFPNSITDKLSKYL